MAHVVTFEDESTVEVDWTEDKDTGAIEATVDGVPATLPLGYPAVGWPWRYIVHEPYGIHPTAKVVSVEEKAAPKRAERARKAAD